MKWTEEKNRTIIELKGRGFTNLKIAEKMKTSENSVVMKLSRLARKGRIVLHEHIYDDKYSFKNVDRELLVKGLFLWWCEGTTFRISERNRVEIVNSDPKLIKIFLNFLRSIKINEGKLRLRIKCSMDEKKRLKKFWSDFLGIPPNKFMKSILARNYTGKRLKYGTITLRYNSEKLAFELDRRLLLLNGNLA
jgi:hypothetical protein